MNKIILTLALIFFLTGCQGVDRLVNGRESESHEMQTSISSYEPLGPTPNFGVVTPSGTKRVVYHGLMPANGVVMVAVASASVRVFVKVRGGINQWFTVGSQYSDAYWYERTGAIIQYHGQLGNTEFCVYQYVADLN